MPILKALREKTKPLNVAELAALLRVTEATVQKWVRNRQIPCIRIGVVLRFDGSVLADWIELQSSCSHPIHPRAARNPAEGRMTWQDLEALARVDVGSSKETP